jgi:hypothetical protein
MATVGNTMRLTISADVIKRTLGRRPLPPRPSPTVRQPVMDSDKHRIVSFTDTELSEIGYCPLRPLDRSSETVATAIIEVSSLSCRQLSWQNNASLNRTLERGFSGL